MILKLSTVCDDLLREAEIYILTDKILKQPLNEIKYGLILKLSHAFFYDHFFVKLLNLKNIKKSYIEVGGGMGFKA